MGCIYKIVNQINQKSYVGLTTKTAEERFKKHIKDSLVANRPHAIHLAIRKYGAEYFTISVLFESNDLNVLNKKEEELIKFHNTLSPNGYNLVSGGKARKLSEESRQKFSDAQKGKKQSKETRLKRSIRLKGRKQLKHIVDHRANSIKKPIRELVTAYTFPSIKEAAEFFHINAKGISKNLHGKSKHYFGKKFVFMEKICK